LENFNLDGIDVAALPAQQKHAKEPDQSVLQQVWEEHVALVMDQVCRMSPEYLDLEQETRLDILLLEQARAENNLQAMLGLEILHVAEDLNLAMQEAEAAEAGHAAGQPGACKMAAFARKIIHSLERQRESLEQAAELLPLVCDAQAYAAAAQTYPRTKKTRTVCPKTVSARPCRPSASRWKPPRRIAPRPAWAICSLPVIVTWPRRKRSTSACSVRP